MIFKSDSAVKKFPDFAFHIHLEGLVNFSQFSFYQFSGNYNHLVQPDYRIHNQSCSERIFRILLNNYVTISNIVRDFTGNKCNNYMFMFANFSSKA